MTGEYASPRAKSGSDRAAAHTWKNDRDSMTKVAPAFRFPEPHRGAADPHGYLDAESTEKPGRNSNPNMHGLSSKSPRNFSQIPVHPQDCASPAVLLGSTPEAAQCTDPPFPPASTGHRLGGGTPAEMQARFGVPAADVMIHTDPAAAAIADQLNASAFTLGRHVVFGTGRFNPASIPGQMLLAHEIAHVVQQRGANSGRAAAPPEAELEASEAAASTVLGLPTPVLSATPVGVACQGKEEEQTWRSRLWHSGTALVEKAKVKARDYIKEQVGVVEGVANEAATFVDTVIWADTSVSDLTDKVVEKVAVAGGLSKEKHEALRSAVQTLTNQPGMTALREAVRKAARKADLVDPVTGAPSTARAVGRAFDWVEKKSDETLFRGMPKEEGLLSSRDIGVLEGSIGSQIALAFTGGEEVQLALKALGAVQSVEGIVTAIQAKPDSWQSDWSFWTQVINLALFMVGLRSAAVGKKILSILLGSAGTLLTAIPAVMQLARDVRATGPDRDERIRADIKALIKALAQAIQQIIMHARGAKPARASGASEGTPAGLGSASETPVPVPSRTTAPAEAPVPGPAESPASVASKSSPPTETPAPLPTTTAPVAPAAETPMPAPVPAETAAPAPVPAEITPPTQALASSAEATPSASAAPTTQAPAPAETPAPAPAPAAETSPATSGRAGDRAALKAVGAQALELQKAAITDPAAVDKLRVLYESQPDSVLRKVKRDPVAAAVLEKRRAANPELAKARESRRQPHEATVKVTEGGKIVGSPQKLVSGGVTPEQAAALGDWEASLASHTEAKAVNEVPLKAGQTMWITGQYDPCGSCRAAMRATANSTGGTIVYWWPGGPPGGLRFPPGGAK